MKREVSFSRVLRAINNYFMFFLLVAFVITSCTMLFVTVLSRDLGIELNGENLNTAAKLTFWNVIFISLIFTLVDALRRRLTVDIPVKRITAAADKMMQGDFSVRIPTVSRAVADDKFNEIINCINKMAEELSGVETLRTDFIANVSHEMKTPLSVMKNYAVMLSAPKIEDAERIEYARAVADASDRLSNMMTNILKLNRLENQKIFPKVEKYDLGEQLCECFLQYESVWERRNIEIECNIEEGVFVSCDAELLSLVWNNLISNAFKFTNDGGRVAISLESDEKYAVVKISDSGCGISKEVGEHMFEKFYQGDSSRATEGNGLGLALVRRVVDIMRGEIGVESAVGVGTTFTVRIGRARDDV